MTPTARIQIRGNKQKIVLEAIIDTGFDGDLCIPEDIAVKLGLELAGVEEVELADGSRKKQLYFKAKVRFLGRSQIATVFLTASNEALVGTDLLANCRLFVDFGTEKVRLNRK